jgi:hypothetical protein
MEYKYPGNTCDMQLSYYRNREGPNAIMVYYKNVSRFVNTSKEMRAVFGTARYTDSVKLASKWCDEMIEQYEGVSEEVGRADTSFASEALIENDPTANTRMVT